MSNLSYYINQLDVFDRTLHEPLFDVTWSRDVKLRTDVTMYNESTSFSRQTFGAIGTQNATGMPWLAQNANTLPNVSVDSERVVTPVRLLGQEVSYTFIELSKSEQTGQPLDVQKFNGMTDMYNMWTDQMVYTGNASVSAEGLINSSQVVVAPVVNGLTGFPEWATKTPDEIVNDVDSLLVSVWEASGYAICPNKLLLPPSNYAYINSKTNGTIGNVSIMTYIKENNICLNRNGTTIDIQPVKWLTGAGVAGSNRMVAYTNEEKRLRFPLVPIFRGTPYYHGINFNSPYVWGFGELEFVYPETIQYRDGI